MFIVPVIKTLTFDFAICVINFGTHLVKYLSDTITYIQVAHPLTDLPNSTQFPHWLTNCTTANQSTQSLSQFTPLLSYLHNSHYTICTTTYQSRKKMWTTWAKVYQSPKPLTNLHNCSPICITAHQCAKPNPMCTTDNQLAKLLFNLYNSYPICTIANQFPQVLTNGHNL